MKTFAANYEHKDGLIFFPDDVQERKKMPYKVDHPSHNNIFMYREIVEYLTEPGAIVCDPMAGAGTILMSSPGRHLYLIELGEYFSERLKMNIAELHPKTQLVQGDCLEYLPRIEEYMGSKADLIIFSPPYADQIQMASGHALYDKREIGEGTAGIRNFSYKHPANLGNMKAFSFNRAMRKVYYACFEATKPGGFICVVIKDRINKGRKVGYGNFHFGLMFKAGYSAYEWHKRHAIGGMFGYFNLNRGIRQVTDEHIIIMRKAPNE